MAALNRKRPFTYVTGMEPICYRQDGQYFMRNGALAEVPPPEEIVEVYEPPPAPRPVRAKPAAVAQEVAGPSEAALKLQMENFGMEWTGVAHARRYLGMED